MHIIELDHPITHKEETITQIEARRPNVRDHILLEQEKNKQNRKQKAIGPMEEDMWLFERMTNVDKDVLYSMDMADVGKLQAFYKECIKPSKDSDLKTETD